METDREAIETTREVRRRRAKTRPDAARDRHMYTTQAEALRDSDVPRLLSAGDVGCPWPQDHRGRLEGGQACEDSCALLRSETRWTEGTITSSRSRCAFSAEGPSTPRAATFDPTRRARATGPTRGASKEEIPR
jgi:hypothetical protein